MGVPNFGVSHADDLFYLWNPLLNTDYVLNGESLDTVPAGDHL